MGPVPTCAGWVDLDRMLTQVGECIILRISWPVSIIGNSPLPSAFHNYTVYFLCNECSLSSFWQHPKSCGLDEPTGCQQIPSDFVKNSPKTSLEGNTSPAVIPSACYGALFFELFTEMCTYNVTISLSGWESFLWGRRGETSKRSLIEWSWFAVGAGNMWILLTSGISIDLEIKVRNPCSDQFIHITNLVRFHWSDYNLLVMSKNAVCSPFICTWIQDWFY